MRNNELKELMDLYGAPYKLYRNKYIKDRVINAIKYKKIRMLKFLLLTSLIVFATYGATKFKLSLNDIKPVAYMKESVRIISIEDKNKNHKSFIDGIAMSESGCNYRPKQSGTTYWGKYQMGPSARKDIGIAVDMETFLSEPELQEICMKLLLLRNKEYLKNYIGKYQYRTLNGFYITESGLLAMAHLVGHGPVIEFLASGGKTNPKDGNGKRGTDYLTEFNGFKLEF